MRTLADRVAAEEAAGGDSTEYLDVLRQLLSAFSVDDVLDDASAATLMPVLMRALAAHAGSGAPGKVSVGVDLARVICRSSPKYAARVEAATGGRPLPWEDSATHGN